jgi:hypothetical protein
VTDPIAPRDDKKAKTSPLPLNLRKKADELAADLAEEWTSPEPAPEAATGPAGS